MLRSNLCNFSDAYILVKGTITIIDKQMQDKQMKEIKMYYLKIVRHLLIV